MVSNIYYKSGLKMRLSLLMGIVLAANIRLSRCQNHTAGSVSDGTLVCFSCRGMIHLKYCNVVERCTKNLGCFVEQFFIGNQPRYNSGCMTPDLTCDDIILHQQRGICATCCNTSLCNSHGCGDSGFGNQVTRGPICYECEYLGNPADCVTIQQCLSGQVCHIAEFQWGDNEYLYSMGCNSKVVCSSPVSSLWTPDHAIIGRSAPTCSRCCEQDFCNLYCADPPHGQTTATTAALMKLTTYVTTTTPTATRFLNPHSTTVQPSITLQTVHIFQKITTHLTPKMPHTIIDATTRQPTTIKSTPTYTTIPTVSSHRRPITLPPVQHICFTCGDSAPDVCEYQYQETQCDPPDNYCMNIVTNTISGSRTVERKCASFNDCYINWWQGTSDNVRCRTYNPDISLTANFQCSFCCIENKCNEALKPPTASLYRDN